MALRGKKPVISNQRLKLFLYGQAKVGKTTLGIQFPKPYWIDTEKSSDKKKYADLLEKSDGVAFQTTSFDEILAEVKALMTTKHDYKTVIIDSFTIPFDQMVAEYGENPKIGTQFGRNYGEANKKAKKLINYLLNMDMNVVVVCHSKNEYGDKLEVLGQTFDGYKKIDYLFDLILEVQKRGSKRYAIVKGTRFDEFTEGDTFECNYIEFSNRYSKEVMEKESTPIKLVSQESVKELKRLIDLLKKPQEVVEKWLTKANAESIEEFPESIALKIIESLNKEIQGVN